MTCRSVRGAVLRAGHLGDHGPAGGHVEIVTDMVAARLSNWLDRAGPAWAVACRAGGTSALSSTGCRPLVGGAHGALGWRDHVDQVVSHVLVDAVDAAADRTVTVALDRE
jgi:hypothetical protein